MHLLKRGMRVRSTQLALDNGVFKAPVKGLVAKDQTPKGVAILVIKDGNKAARRYAPSFWEEAP